MLIVTHRNPIFSMVDRVFIMEHGKIISDKTPEQLGIKRGWKLMSDITIQKTGKRAFRKAAEHILSSSFIDSYFSTCNICVGCDNRT